MEISKYSSPHIIKCTRHHKNITEHESGVISAEEHRIHTTFTAYSQQNAKNDPIRCCAHMDGPCGPQTLPQSRAHLQYLMARCPGPL